MSLINGLDAIVYGLRDGGVQSVYNFPGFMSHDIFEKLGGEKISLNERVAYAEAFGASLAGKRAMVSFKNVGLNIAADTYLHSLIAGVRAGLVVVITDDIEVWGSQESQDSRHYFDFFGGLWFEPSTIQEAYDICAQSFDLSEKLDLPIVIRLTNAFFEKNELLVRKEKRSIKDTYSSVQPEKFVVHPVYYNEQRKRLKEKNDAIGVYIESLTVPIVNKYDKGVIIVGATINSSQDIPKDTDIMTVTTYPLPTHALIHFVEAHKEIKVIESGNDFVTKKIQALTNTRDIQSILPDAMSKTSFSSWSRYGKFFEALVSVKPDMVIGDITQYTVEATNSVKVALSLGAAVSTTIGYAESTKNEKVFCLSGDCSFLHEGIGILQEAVERNLSFNLVIIDNGGSWCTGGQTVTGNLELINSIEGILFRDVTYDDMSVVGLTKLLEEMKSYEGVAVTCIKVPMGSFEREG